MSTLSEKLADLSVLVGDIEARAEAFLIEQPELRDRRVKELREELQTLQDRLKYTGLARRDRITKAWSSLYRSLRAKADEVQAHVGAKKAATDGKSAQRRAEQLEINALLALDFALFAVTDAELAVSEAINARLEADEMEQP